MNPVIVVGAGYAPGVVYATIYAAAGAPDTLRSVDVAGAPHAMLHLSTTDSSGRAAMRMIRDVPIPAAAELRLEPGALHVMVEGLHPAPPRGDSVAVTFHFARAGAIASFARVIEFADVQRETARPNPQRRDNR